MNTHTRATGLAAAAARFPFLGPTTADHLLALVRAELGHESALDDFQPHGAHSAMALAPGTILHIVSGNTPAAGLQSLIRGLLLGARNLCKIPSAGLPEIAAFRAALPDWLAERVEISAELPDEWLARADAVIVFGGDETIAHFRARVRPGQIFIAHGHKLSAGFVFDDPGFASMPGAARDVAAFDQQGCLSPHAIYVRGDARAYAARLAGEMEALSTREPRGPISLSEKIAIRAAREELAFRAANDGGAQLWQSADSTAWTVAFDPAPGFPRSPLNRFIFIKPMPADPASEFREVRAHLSCAGIWPAAPEHARPLAALGFSRICPLGRMQSPPWTWHQDGQRTLAALVRWADFEPKSGDGNSHAKAQRRKEAGDTQGKPVKYCSPAG